MSGFGVRHVKLHVVVLNEAGGLATSANYESRGSLSQQSFVSKSI